MNDYTIGGSRLSSEAHQAVSDLIAMLGEKYYFRHGQTAAFWDVVRTLAEHLGEGKP